jgi:NAD(P)-dependent dehydrogenase (short-subunit alcohol dehydrogenase family)
MDLSGGIVVAGCARGMGAATLGAYLRAGALVVGMDVNADDGAETAESAQYN